MGPKIAVQNQRHMPHARSLRESTFSRSIPDVFHRMRMRRSCNFQASELIVAERARPCSSGPGELLTALSGRGQCWSFRCKMVSTDSVRKGAMTRRRASTATLFSLQNEERRVQSHRFSGRLAYGEGISERNLASKIDQHRRRSTSGRCWAAADRSSAAKGDSLRATPLADEKNGRSLTVCDDVNTLGRLTPEVVENGRMAVNDAFAACVAGYRSHSPEVLHFGRFGRSARVAGKTSWTQQISRNRPAAD